MGKIEDLLMTGEHVIKRQGNVQLVTGGSGMPAGDLFLTDRRLLFLVSRGWSSITPGAGLGAKDLILSLEDVKSVDKGGLGHVKVRADKEYQFAVTMWHSGGWVDEIRHAISLSPPPPSQQEPMQRPSPATTEQSRPKSTATGRRFCPDCGNPVKPEARFCESCGAKLQ